MAYKVYYTKQALKELHRLDRTFGKKIADKILLLNYPFPSFLDIRKLQGEDTSFRLRVGDYRVIFEVDKKLEEIWVYRVASRGEVYVGF